jgi:hypothetical protein
MSSICRASDRSRDHQLDLECISSSAIALTAIEFEILGLEASTAPDDNTPRVIKAHAVVRRAENA